MRDCVRCGLGEKHVHRNPNLPQDWTVIPGTRQHPLYLFLTNQIQREPVTTLAEVVMLAHTLASWMDEDEALLSKDRNVFKRIHAVCNVFIKDTEGKDLRVWEKQTVEEVQDIYPGHWLE